MRARVDLVPSDLSFPTLVLSDLDLRLARAIGVALWSARVAGPLIVANHGGERAGGVDAEGELQPAWPAGVDRRHSVRCAGETGILRVPVGRVAHGEPVAARTRKVDENA